MLLEHTFLYWTLISWGFVCREKTDKYKRCFLFIFTMMFEKFLFCIDFGSECLSVTYMQYIKEYSLKSKTNECVTTVLKKIRLYCISKYDSFIHVRGKKNQKGDALKTHIQNIYIHIFEKYLGVLSKQRGKIKYKQWNAV